MKLTEYINQTTEQYRLEILGEYTLFYAICPCEVDDEEDNLGYCEVIREIFVNGESISFDGNEDGTAIIDQNGNVIKALTS